jgi:hypothetical protein
MINKPNYILKAAKYTVIEKTAAEFAAVFYEAARSSGLTSEFKNPRSFARANFTKFIPKAVEVLISMLGRSDIHDLMKQEIYEALMERNNDPTLCQVFPNNDVEKQLREMLPKGRDMPVIINTQNFKATDH